jgi:hypothetical protein
MNKKHFSFILIISFLSLPENMDSLVFNISNLAVPANRKL